jgi:hypothetical protein
VKTAILICLAFGLGASALSAQVVSNLGGGPSGVLATPLINESKADYMQVKTYLTAAAAKMPAGSYSFKASLGVRSFGALVAHIADAQLRACSAMNGMRKAGEAASKTSKADLTAALAESFRECDMSWDAITGANAFEMPVAGGGQRTRLGTLIGNTIHDNEEYGYMAVYLRLKGIVPPSSENAGGRGIAAPGR